MNLEGNHYKTNPINNQGNAPAKTIEQIKEEADALIKEAINGLQCDSSNYYYTEEQARSILQKAQAIGIDTERLERLISERTFTKFTIKEAFYKPYRSWVRRSEKEAGTTATPEPSQAAEPKAEKKPAKSEPAKKITATKTQPKQEPKPTQEQANNFNDALQQACLNNQPADDLQNEPEKNKQPHTDPQPEDYEVQLDQKDKEIQAKALHDGIKAAKGRINNLTNETTKAELRKALANVENQSDLIVVNMRIDYVREKEQESKQAEPEPQTEPAKIELNIIDDDGTIIKADGEKLDANSEEAQQIREETEKERAAEIESRKTDHEYYDNYTTQLGLRNFIIDHLKPYLLYDKDSGQWYVKDKDGCFPPSKTNGYGEIANIIEGQIKLLLGQDDTGKLYGKARKFCNKTNISQAIDLASPFIEGRPGDIAYVFDDGKTLHIIQDENGKYSVVLKDNPNGLKTQFRVKGEYWKGTIDECPNDFKEWINGYGSPEFVKALIRIMSRSLTCRPDKLCFQFTSEAGNTGKSTLTDAFMGSWGKHCFTRIEAKEIMTKNQTGRRTALLQAMQKPYTVVNEAEGRIDEGTYKEVVDTSDTFSGNYCGRDRVEVPRRSQLFIESNNLIRATNTSAYQNRTYPIEFTNTFPMDDRIQAKVRGKWQKYARGVIIGELEEYINAFNEGKGIEEQLKEICPELAENRMRLTQAQDYRQSIINTICQNTGNPNDTESWDYLYGRVRDYIVGMGKEIPEWGMTKNQKYREHEGRWEVSIQAKKSFNKTLKDMKYDVYRKQEGTQKITYVSKIKINES